MKESSHFEITNKFKKSLYKVLDAFSHVRNPTIWEYEYPEGVAFHKEYERLLHVYKKRIERLNVKFMELEDVALDVQVLLGREFNLKMRNIREKRDQLESEIRYELAVKQSEHAASFYKEKVKRKEHKQIIEKNPMKENFFDKELGEIRFTLEGDIRKSVIFKLKRTGLFVWRKIMNFLKKND
jgi:hypothetical protein